MPYSGRKSVAYAEVRVPKAPLLACLTCPLCSYLVREATTISECLHTFCKDCITAELSNEDSGDCCPMCNVALGTGPLEKLRVDHQLNDLKEKLFPSNVKKRKLGVAIESPGSSVPTRRKEKSLYSLGVKGSPPVYPGLANRKPRAPPGGHVSSEPSSIDEEEVEEDEEESRTSEEEEEEEEEEQVAAVVRKADSRNGFQNGAAEPQVRGSRKSVAEWTADAKVYPQSEPRGRKEDPAASPSGGDREYRTYQARPWTVSKVGQRLVQSSKSNASNGGKPSSSSAGQRDNPKSNRGSRKINVYSSSARAGKNVEQFLSPLDALAQAANADAAMEGAGAESEPASPSLAVRHTLVRSASDIVAGQKEAGEAKVAATPKDESPGTSNGQALQVRIRHTVNGIQDRPSIIRNPARAIAGPVVLNPPSKTPANGIWFHLEAGDVQTNEDALPPLTSPFVRIKDGKLPVYQVKKYLAQKFCQKVKSEMEVEITCRGQPVVSSLPLESIRDIWFSASVPDQSQSQPQTQVQTQSQAQGQGQGQGETSGPSANGSAPAGPPTPKDFLMVLTYRRHRKPRIC